MKYLSLLVFFALVAGAAVFGAWFEPGVWYATLAKPAWTPPGWVFGPVWMVLYLMIAVAGWLAWRSDFRARTPLNELWVLQLVLNAVWSWLFFGLNRPELAFLDILLLLAAIMAFILLAWSQVRLAAALFIPYAAWVAFAAVLNYEIIRLNP